MSKEVTYKMKSVIGKLSAKIANLEVELAHEQSAKEAYMKRVEELEKDNKPQEVEKDDSRDKN